MGGRIVQYSKQAEKFLDKQEPQTKKRILATSDIKERLIGAITVMDEAGARKLWEIVEGLYSGRGGWDSVPEEEPDEIDLEMIREALNDPDCREFVPAGEVNSLLD